MSAQTSNNIKIAVDALAVSRKSAGGFTVLHGLLPELAKICDYQFVLYMASDDIEKSLGSLDGRIEYVYAPKWARNAPMRHLWQQFSLPGLIKKANCNLIYSASGYPELFSSLPVISHQQNLWAFERPKEWWPQHNRRKIFFYRQICKLAIRISDANIYISDYLRECAERMVPSTRDKNFTVYNGLTPSQPCDPEQKDDYSYNLSGQTFCLCVSTVAPHKNHIRLMEAFKKVSESCDGLNLVVAGSLNSDYGRDVVNLCRQLGLKDRVVFLGSLNYGNILKLYEQALFSVNVSFLEGFGLTILESMAHECPVVCSNTTALPEIGGDAVLYCDPLDISDIADKMARMYIDLDLRRRSKMAGKERSKRFTWEKSAAKLIDIFNRLIA